MTQPRAAKNRACKFYVGTGFSFPATRKGLLQARLQAKRMARRDGSIDFGVRLVCGGQRPAQYDLETCSSKTCRKA